MLDGEVGGVAGMGEILLAPLHLAVLPRDRLIRDAATLLGAADLAAAARRTSRSGIGAVDRCLLTTGLIAAWLRPAWLFTTRLRCCAGLLAGSGITLRLAGGRLLRPLALPLILTSARILSLAGCGRPTPLLTRLLLACGWMLALPLPLGLSLSRLALASSLTLSSLTACRLPLRCGLSLLTWLRLTLAAALLRLLPSLRTARLMIALLPLALRTGSIGMIGALLTLPRFGLAARSVVAVVGCRWFIVGGLPGFLPWFLSGLSSRRLARRAIMWLVLIRPVLAPAVLLLVLPARVAIA